MGFCRHRQAYSKIYVKKQKDSYFAILNSKTILREKSKMEELLCSRLWFTIKLQYSMLTIKYSVFKAYYKAIVL